MIDTQALRQKVLDLAIRGKLTEQLPEDGTAEELYDKIQQEKQTLIKEGKIKKEKPLPPITTDQIPFKVPGNWKWVKFGTAITLISGVDFNADEYNDAGRGIPYITGASNFFNGGILVNRWTETSQHIANEGDVLLVCKGSGYGKTAICNIQEAHIARQIMAVKKTDLLIMGYVLYFLKSNFNYLKSRGQGLIPGIDRNSVLNLLLPLPPLAEQKRIVEKLESIFSALDKIDSLQSEYSDNLSALKTKIIEAGIQGKLTEQLPEDGTAEELYDKIQQEKQTLIKEGKIKKEKLLPPISEEEIPFALPGNWKWVRIGNIFTLKAGKNIAANKIHDVSDDEHQYSCYGGNGIRGYVGQTNVSGFHVLIGRQGALCGNINFAEGNFYATEHAVVVYDYAGTVTKWAGLTLRALNLNQYATSVAQPGLAVNKIEKVLIPLPPLAEQKRIVAKLDTVLAIIDARQSHLEHCR